MDIELELWHDSKGELSMLLLKHVDEFQDQLVTKMTSRN